MICHTVDLVAGDFNGTAWRCHNRGGISSIDEVFADCAMPTPTGPPPWWGPGSSPNNRTDVCGFLEPPNSDKSRKVRKHGAFSIPRQALGLRPTDQSCHHMRHGYTWILSIGAITTNPTNEFGSKSVLRCTNTANGKGAYERIFVHCLLNDHAYLVVFVLT